MMENKPPIADVKNLVPEATGLTEIDSGGYKVVYKGTVGKSVEAVKLIRIPTDENDSSVREENVRRIQREITLLRNCISPYLVKLGSIPPREASVGGYQYLVYSEEYLPGESVRKLIKEGHRPNLGELIDLGTSLLLAVQELAEKRIVHRDIKPENIIRTSSVNRPFVLLDLGIAFHLGGTPLTRDSAMIPGTRYYLAPEMLDVGFRRGLDYRADLYTVGLTLYEFASGENPFFHHEDPPYSTLVRIKTHTPEPLNSLRDDIPVQFCALIDQLLKKLPALRPANIPALIKRLEDFK
jgi:serine/threonine-protein kinase